MEVEEVPDDDEEEEEQEQSGGEEGQEKEEATWDPDTEFEVEYAIRRKKVAVGCRLSLSLFAFLTIEVFLLCRF